MELINKKLIKNYIIDLRKHEIDKFERAKIIKEYMEDRGLSIRQFSRTFGFSKSCVEDWLLYNRITKDKYDELIKKGYKSSDIYRDLRSKKSFEKPLSELDIEISNYLCNIKKIKNSFVHSPDSEYLIKNLINELNIILMKIDKLEGRRFG